MKSDHQPQTIINPLDNEHSKKEKPPVLNYDASNSTSSVRPNNRPKESTSDKKVSIGRKKRRRTNNRLVLARRAHLWSTHDMYNINKSNSKSICDIDLSTFKPQQSNRTKPKSRREILRNWPRASDIVPDIEAGDASDAGLNSDQISSHKRRKRAAALAMEYLDNEGKLKPVPEWERENAGLQSYTPFLIPPEGDRTINPKRAPPELLSRSLRGCGLRSRRHVSVKDFFSWDKKTCQYCGSSSKDWEFLVDSSSSNDVGKPDKPQDPPARKEPHRKEITVEFSKEDFLKSILEEKDEATGSSSTESEEGTVVKDCPIVDTPVQEKPASDQPQTVTEFFDLLAKDPGMLMQTIAPSSTQTDNIEIVENEKEANPDQHADNIPKDQPRSCKRSRPKGKFNTAKEEAMEFCQQPSQKQRKISVSDKTDVFREAARAMKKEVHEKRKRNQPEQKASSIGSRIMSKMGFRGRLGAHEDGITEPLKPLMIQGRSGIGARPLLSVGGTSISRKRVEVQITADPYNDVANLRAEENDFPKSPSMQEVEDRREEGEYLRDSDEYETEIENSFWYDSNRRAVIIDFDLLPLNAQTRKKAALVKMFLSSDLDIKPHIVEEAVGNSDKDYSETELINLVLKKHRLKDSNDQIVLSLLEKLEETYSSLEKPQPNEEFLNFLDLVKRHVEVGIIHRNSRKRFISEMDDMGLSTFFPEHLITSVSVEDRWPYKSSWKDALCRVGVQANQTLLILDQSTFRSSGTSGLVVGSLIGARTSVWTNALEDGQNLGKLNFVSESRVAIPASNLEAGVEIGKLLSTPFTKQKRRRVLYLNNEDGLWHCGAEEFREATESQADARSLVISYGSKELVWVNQSDVVPVTRLGYRKLKQADFPGLFDPMDLDSM